eukprot:2290977-Amphidinium_carterae.3
MPKRPVPIPQRELDEMEKNKKTIPPTPTTRSRDPTAITRRCYSKNLRNGATLLSTRQVATAKLQGRYLKRVYDGFELCNYLDKVKPKVPQDEECNASTALQQLLGLSLHYAPTFFSALTKQKLEDLRQLGWPEQQAVQHELVLRDTKLLELYIVLPQKALDMWITCGSEVHYAITDYINLYVYNYPDDFAQNAVQFTQQDYYFVVVHTTDKLLEQMTSDMKTLTGRDLCGWYARKDLDYQYQIKGERLGRESNGQDYYSEQTHGDEDGLQATTQEGYRRQKGVQTDALP